MKSFIAVAFVAALAALALANFEERREVEIENTKAEATNIQQIMAGFSGSDYNQAQTFFKAIKEAHNSNVIQAAEDPEFSTERDYVSHLLSAYQQFGHTVEDLLSSDLYASSAYKSDKGFHYSVEHVKCAIHQREAKLTQDLQKLGESSE